MNDISVDVKTGELTNYKPVEALNEIDVAEAAKEYYIKAADLDGLHKAIEVIYNGRHDFVTWWDSKERRGKPEKDDNGNRAVTILSDLNMDKMQVSRWRKEVEKGTEIVIEKQYVKIVRSINPAESSGDYHISSGENDWYTPQEIIESARAVMGSIDLDPASSDMAQESINARLFYTKENSGLDVAWIGNTWMNPPYSMPEIEIFIDKLLSEDVKQWIVLTNNSSDTAWFHKLLAKADQVCFTKGRVKFTNPSSETMATRQGQTFFYHGENHLEFAEEFKQYGAIMEVIHDYTRP